MKNKNIKKAESKKVESDVESDVDLDKEELINDLKRVQADFINYRNRVEKEKEQFANYKVEQFVLELLDIVDNLELSLKDCKDEGVKLIHKQFLDLLEKNNIRKIKENKEFNPEKHEAIEKVENEEENKIVEIVKRGYMFNEKVLRPTIVKVGGGK